MLCNAFLKTWTGRCSYEPTEDVFACIMPTQDASLDQISSIGPTYYSQPADSG